MPDAPDPKSHVHRRGPDGRMEVGADWETLIDRQIREAISGGAFDDLPHQGKRLPNDGNPYAGEYEMAFHLLINEGVAPPWIEADKDYRDLEVRMDAILARASVGPAPTPAARRRDRTALEDLVVRINAAVARVNAGAPTDRQHRRPLLARDVLARYDEACRR